MDTSLAVESVSSLSTPASHASNWPLTVKTPSEENVASASVSVKTVGDDSQTVRAFCRIKLRCGYRLPTPIRSSDSVCQLCLHSQNVVSLRMTHFGRGTLGELNPA